MNALELENVSKRYPGFEMQDLNLTVPAGHIMGLLGRNGAGKTTLFKLINNYVLPERGSIRVYGHDLHEAEAQAKSHMAYVADTPALPKDRRVKDFGMINAAIYPQWSSEKFTTLLDRFGLDTRKRISSLSKGESVKCYIASKLAQNADLLLLDEPTAGLDPVVRHEVMDILQQEMLNETRSILYATHITSDLENISDYITIMDAGSILTTISQADLDTSWRILKGDLSKVENLPGQIRAASASRHTNSLLIDNYPSISNELPQQIMVERPSLEEILIHLTAEETP